MPTTREQAISQKLLQNRPHCREDTDCTISQEEHEIARLKKTLKVFPSTSGRECESVLMLNLFENGIQFSPLLHIMYVKVFLHASCQCFDIM